MKRLLMALLGLALVIAGCGDGDDAATTTTAPAVTTTAAVTTIEVPTTEVPTTTAAPETSTTTSSTTTTEPPATTTTLPGELVDYGPEEGAVLAAIGVETTDVLNVRSGPGIDFEILTALAPLSNHAIAEGETRLLSNSAWYKVDVNGIIGWASSRYLAQLGHTYDDTVHVLETAFPYAETMVQMGEEVAAVYTSDEPRSTVTIVDGPHVGDISEITVDVVGVGDDALVGFRLHIFAQPDPGGEGWEIKSVEVTTLCGRGVTDEGYCL